MYEIKQINETANKKTTQLNSYLAYVNKVYLTESDFKDLKKDEDFITIYNNNTNFSDKDSRYYGAVDFKIDNTLDDTNLYHAFPFDKNNFTMPLVGETIVVIQIESNYFYLPYSTTVYPNFREDYKTTQTIKGSKIQEADTKNTSKDYNKTKQTGINSKPNVSQHNSPVKKYDIKEKIKFLKPKEGDTILSGRVGNTIRFSEFFLTEDGKTSSPSVFIRNKQNPELDSKPIGTLVEEDINNDGSSIYITSGKVKVPFKETIKKDKVAFKGYPSSKDLSGDQLFINSDRIILSAKASEFIIFGKGNTGIITDGNFTIDSEKEVYVHTNKNVTIHSAGANQIFLNSENGDIYLGKNTGAGAAGAGVQKMVLGGELVQLMSDLIDAINQQSYLTPAGTSGVGPLNSSAFNGIKSKLNTLLSAKNYLSKN
jgi:hypothetical protein